MTEKMHKRLMARRIARKTREQKKMHENLEDRKNTPNSRRRKDNCT